MDKSWVRLDRRSPEYFAGLKVFLDNAPKTRPRNEIMCHCVTCKNCEVRDIKTVEQLLVVKGMWPFYMNTRWREHGESDLEHIETEDDGELDIDGMHEFLNETFSRPIMFEGPTPEAEKFYELLEDANKEVYPGCKFKKLEVVVRLYPLKCLGGVSDNIFSKFLELIKELLPEGECLPASFYQTKKLVSELGLTYEKIDDCPNDCMLFWKDVDDALRKYKHCGTSRYSHEEREGVGKDVPAKVLRYFPLKPRLQRLYMSKHIAPHIKVAIIKQLIQGQHQGASSSQTLQQPAFQISSHPPHMYQQTASSSQPVQHQHFKWLLILLKCFGNINRCFLRCLISRILQVSLDYL